jgi:D-3-phosphoglycerate dehydrogenase / 2-oxoglutarate reductase
MNIVIPDEYQAVIERLPCYAMLDGHDVTTFREPAKSFEELVARLSPADVIVAIRERVNFNRALIERLPNLKLIALVGRNATTIDYAACSEHGIMVSRGKSNAPTSPAELTVALMMASRRNIVVEAERMRRGEWPYTLSHRLRGSTLGIFGLGNIGSLVAQAGAGLGMRVLVWGQETSARRAKEAGYDVAASKAALFEESDVLSLHVRARGDTSGIVGPDDLARMKPTALLINTSRAGLIQPGALLAALRAGRPGYAAVDVYEEEPIMNGDHPFLSMPNVVCTPHLGWAEWENFDLYFSEAFDQIVAFAAGQPMRLANEKPENGSWRASWIQG